MLIDKLLPTQEGPRLALETRAQMVAYVKSGGIYDGRDPGLSRNGSAKISIDRFPDGLLFVRDGLHRVVSVLLGRNDQELKADEFVVVNRAYSMYREIDLADWWFTPFDPRVEVRLAEFATFKNEVVARLRAGTNPTRFILENRLLYCRPRTIQDTFQNLALRWLEPETTV